MIAYPTNPRLRTVFAVCSLAAGLTSAALSSAQDDPAATRGAAQNEAQNAAQSAAQDTVQAPGKDMADERAKGAEVTEAAICTSIENRRPVGAAESFSVDVDRLYCFTDVRGAQGDTLVHAWIHEGTTRARVELPVKGDRWRTWSTKQILPGWTGAWEVKVLTSGGAVLHTSSFTVE